MNTKQIFNPDAAAQRFASLSRRNFLRGLGACMALPALESVMPVGLLAANGKAANLARTATGAPLRMAYVYFPNGAIQPSWWWTPKGGSPSPCWAAMEPGRTSSATELPPALEAKPC